MVQQTAEENFIPIGYVERVVIKKPAQNALFQQHYSPISKKVNVMRTHFVQTCLFFILLFSRVNAQESALPRVEIAGTQLQKITSSLVQGQEYNLYINLPRGYQDAAKKFPVVFVLDAQWDFTLAYSLYGEEYYDGFIPEVILVGITWGGVNPNPDSLRVRDFSPTHVNNAVQSGGAPKFLSFLKDELIPFIDSHYRTIPGDRTLMGSSFGGLFTLYAMFNGTESFHRYILTSPYIAYDNYAISASEKMYAEKNSSLPVKLFMAQGELEGGVPQFQKFVDNLKAREFKDFSMQSRILEHMGHSGGKAEGYTRGLQFVFGRPSLMLTDNILNKYTGIYEFGNGASVKMMKEKSRLIAQLPSGEKVVLYAATETNFYREGGFLNVHFRKDDSGNVSGVQFEQYNGETFLKKIK